ncbi:MAG: sugar ABC transporter ATP-binding protein [Desulfobacterales bacterium]|nr:MAG: sugar ABC transporter ATP-binding protein [Desulfobacterales bacterium]
MATLLDLKSIHKSYGAVQALNGVSLTVREGEVLAICGDNGAGKSTLIKIVSGAEAATSGQVFLRGKEVHFASPADALACGVATIYQDLALAPRLQVYQNIFMGAELTRATFIPFLRILDKKKMSQAAADYLGRLNIEIKDMKAPVASLSGGQRQAVAISRALRWQASLVIMDEPTAALGVRETAQVLDLIRQLHDQAVTIIIISHNMEDVVAVATRIVILKNGLKLGECLTENLTAAELSRMIALGDLGDRNIIRQTAVE